jgi:hypothetical protein
MEPLFQAHVLGARGALLATLAHFLTVGGGVPLRRAASKAKRSPPKTNFSFSWSRP